MDRDTIQTQQAKEEEENKTEDQKEEKRKEYKNRSGLINKLIDQVQQVSGKDAVSGLQTLAKIQGLDKPEEESEEDKRNFFLPWVSGCRSCKLMQIFRGLAEQTP